MIVSDKLKIVYAAPPKTGSITIRHLMLKPPFHGYLSDRRFDHHNTYIMNGKRSYFHFMTVRHPYLRAHSFWRFMHAGSIDPKAKNDRRRSVWPRLFPPRLGYPSFSDWLHTGPRQKHRRSQFFTAMKNQWSCNWHKQKLGKLPVHIVHQERYDEELRLVPGFELFESFPVDNKQEPAKKPWYEEFKEGDVKRIQELWPGDFSLFGYEKDFKKVKEGKYFVES